MARKRGRRRGRDVSAGRSRSRTALNGYALEKEMRRSIGKQGTFRPRNPTPAGTTKEWGGRKGGAIS